MSNENFLISYVDVRTLNMNYVELFLEVLYVLNTLP